MTILKILHVTIIIYSLLKNNAVIILLLLFSYHWE